MLICSTPSPNMASPSMLCHPCVSQKHKIHGFTLVEMMVTIAILVIGLGVAVPSMTDWINRSQLDAATQSLKSALRSAQSQAQSQSRVIAVIPTNAGITGDTLQPSQITGKLTHWASYAIPINGSSDSPRLLQTDTLHSNAKITVTLTGGKAICFNSLGRLSRQTLQQPLAIDCASPTTLTLQHTSLPNKSSTLTVSASGKTTLTP